MTIFMVAAYRRLPRRERYPLPPRRVTMNVAEAAGVEAVTEEPNAQTPVTLAGHLAYGAAAGAAYGALAGRTEAPPVAEGVGFGLLVWAGSYLGWLPALGLHPSATQEPARRNALMIAAHVVWGATLGFLVDRQMAREPVARRLLRVATRRFLHRR
jgi:putative membrane protein